MRREIPDISLGTVHRNLRLLRESGQIMEIDLRSTFHRSDGNPSSHYHFGCEECSRVFDVDEPANKELDLRVAKETGFKISQHHLEFRG